MPLNLEDVALFKRIAAAGSLSEAARQMGLTPQIASRRLQRLEAYLGVKLLHRTTRRSALTNDGEVFLAAAQRLTAEAEAAEASVGPNKEEPRGTLRVSAPATFGRKAISPFVPGLLARHPDLRIDLQLTDSVVDLIENAIDIAVRIATMRPTTHIARKLADNPIMLVAAPAYIKKNGVPRTLDDLAQHSCLVRTGTDVWSFINDGTERQIRVSGAFTSNANEALREAALSGLGLGLHSRWDIDDHLANGELVKVPLEDAEPRRLSIWAVRPGGRETTPRAKVFLDALEGMLHPHRKLPRA
ncbi:MULTISPECIES: LysR family transcriptional regulator [unclassified Roseitalea]|uniref:LysR family transcriptional regulator n=1 Tax=unclassified Roseitalea TaxID=2639107 RepID=UPI00273DE383|nr:MULTISPECIES: LysR family transcriptional regulator [unclassified Roseitalea]